jgi:hypothetical protein
LTTELDNEGEFKADKQGIDGDGEDNEYVDGTDSSGNGDADVLAVTTDVVGDRGTYAFEFPFEGLIVVTCCRSGKDGRLLNIDADADGGDDGDEKRSPSSSTCRR